LPISVTFTCNLYLPISVILFTITCKTHFTIISLSTFRISNLSWFIININLSNILIYRSNRTFLLKKKLAVMYESSNLCMRNNYSYIYIILFLQYNSVNPCLDFVAKIIFLTPVQHPFLTLLYVIQYMRAGQKNNTRRVKKVIFASSCCLSRVLIM
jgi:hypothetical protein